MNVYSHDVGLLWSIVCLSGSSLSCGAVPFHLCHRRPQDEFQHAGHSDQVAVPAVEPVASWARSMRMVGGRWMGRCSNVSQCHFVEVFRGLNLFVGDCRVRMGCGRVEEVARM